jgi:GntR family transcriptional regulator
LVGRSPLARPGKVVGGIYRALYGLGLAPASAHETITARMPTAAEAEAMILGLGSPVLGIERVTRGRDGRVLLFTEAVAVGDRVALNYLQTYTV